MSRSTGPGSADTRASRGAFLTGAAERRASMPERRAPTPRFPLSAPAEESGRQLHGSDKTPIWGSILAIPISAPC